jgi:hypothetical protein
MDLQLTTAERNKLVQYANGIFGSIQDPHVAEDLVREILEVFNRRAGQGTLRVFNGRDHYLNSLKTALRRKLVSRKRHELVEKSRQEILKERTIVAANGRDGSKSARDAKLALEEIALTFMRRPDHELAKLFPKLPRNVLARLAEHYNRPPEDLGRSMERRFAIIMYLLHSSAKAGVECSESERVILSSGLFQWLFSLASYGSFENALQSLGEPDPLGKDPDIGPYFREFKKRLLAFLEECDTELNDLIEHSVATLKPRDLRKRALQGTSRNSNGPLSRKGGGTDRS